MIYFSNLFLHWLFLLIFISCFNRSLQSNNASLSNCLTQLADACFKNFSKSLNCSTDSNAECNDPETTCKLFDDSLNCSTDIIYGDCSKCSTCIDKLQSWLKGLRAMKDKMCKPMNSNGIEEIPLLRFQKINCWDRNIFTKCVDEQLNIQHVVDMINRSYTSYDCHHTIDVMINCNSISGSKSNTQCSIDVYQFYFIEELLKTFFLESKCDLYDNDTELFNGIEYFTSSKYVFLLTIAIMIFNC